MGLRIALSIIALLLIGYNFQNENDWFRVKLKLQVFTLSIPYYFFQMVFISLLFSVLTFYKNLRNILFPEVPESDAHNIMFDTPNHRGEDLHCMYFSL